MMMDIEQVRALCLALLKSLIEHAHHEVVKKLTQKLRTQLKLPL